DANGNFTRFGDAGNGLIRALNSWQVDFALTKETKLTEGVSMEFAVQAFNILNHVQLGDPGSLTLNYDPTVPGTNLGVPGSFGIITSTVNFNNNNDNKASPNTVKTYLIAKKSKKRIPAVQVEIVRASDGK